MPFADAPASSHRPGRATQPGRRLRAVYLADTMADVRMLEGFSRTFDLTLLVPAALGDEATNHWPPRPPARVERVELHGGRVGFALRAARWLRGNRRRFDVVIVLDELAAALAANLAHRLGGPPVILQLGRPTLEYIRCQRGLRPRWQHLARLTAGRLLVAANERLASGIGAVSDHVKAGCRNRNPNIRTVPWYGVDTAFFAPHTTKLDARRALGLPEDAPIVMLRSRMAPEKDPDTFLAAVARLREEGRRIIAVHMGGEWAEMRDLAARHGVEIIARAPSAFEEIPLWYIAADVNVQTSHAEGLGVSPLEALACGTPVVVTAVGGLPEVVDGGRCGALVPAGDPAALARAIAGMLDDPQAAARAAARGRTRVVERFGETEAFGAWTQLAASVVPHERAGRLRVLYCDHETRLSGGQRDLVDLVRALDPACFDVHAALPGDGELAEALRAHAATVHIVPMAGGLRRVSRWELARRPHRAAGQAVAAAAAAIRLLRLARRLRPAVVHPNSLKTHLLASPAARLSGSTLVWHVRDILEGWLGSAWRLLAGALADRIICLSEVAAEPFRSGRASAKVRVVYNGVRPAVPDPDAVQAWRERLGAEGGHLVGIVGQLAHWKGQDVFVEAAARLAKDRDDVRFAVAGSCLFPDNERVFVDEVRARACELGLDGRLHWLGQVDPVEPLLAAFDVFVHASRLPEPFGRVIVEAMACGTPVVASAAGAGPELVSPETGRLVPPDDPEALARALDELVSDPLLRERMGDAGRAAAARFDIARTGEGVLAVYDELGR